MSVQGDLLTAPSTLSDLLAGTSRCARLARLFIARRGEWIDGTELQRIAGVYAWRTRVSDLRKRPWLLDVENRVRWVRQDCLMCDGDGFAEHAVRLNCPKCKGSGKAAYAISEYRLVA